MSILKSLVQVPAVAAAEAPREQVSSIYAWREKADAARMARRPGELVAKCGWPERAMFEASRADVTKPCILAVTGWEVRDGCVRVLSGETGVGKTVAAAWWAIRQKPLVEFVTLATYVRSSRYDGSRDRWHDAPALVVDEAGVEFADDKGAMASDFDDLVNEFYSHGRPLLITTNAAAPVFKARYGERVADRIRECDGWRGISNAPSLRGAR